jgi:uncharacterized protein (TIGR03084 family)
VAEYEALLADLEAEEAALDAVVAELDAEAWRTPTAAVGWDIRDTIAHLAVSEELATTALTDPTAFAVRLAALVEDIPATEAALIERGRTMPGIAVLQWWRTARAETVDALRRRGPRERVPWITGPMSAMSFATSRLMETWAHGNDIADGLAVPMVPTVRLRHVAELGVRTRGFSFAVRGLPEPKSDVRVELDAPDGATWVWGTSDVDVVRGPARDFCLVVTQRRHPLATALESTGDAALAWIAIAQAFAGPPTDQRPPVA